VLIAAAGALGLVAIAVAAIMILTSANSSSGSNQSVTVYHQKLTGALAPVLAANKNLSSALQSIDGSQASLSAAGNTASQASSAITAAKGAVAVLTAPSADTPLSQQVQQALGAESGYLQDVSLTLSNPTGQGAAQLQTLSTSAQTALIPLASLAPGIDSSVSGAGNLANWAQGAAAAAAAAQLHHQQQQSSSSAGGASSSGGSGATPSGGSPTATYRPCGSNIQASSTASCPFAENVFSALDQQWSSGDPGPYSLTVFSPVTSQSYNLQCQSNAAGMMICTNQSDTTAVVTFPVSAL
jgi:hypothetical protein